MKLLSFLSLFLCVLSLIAPCYASNGEGVDMMDFPQKLSDALGIPVLASQLLISAIFLFAFLLPCASKNPLVPLMIGLPLMGFLIAMNWLPFWLMLLVVMIVAILYAGKVKTLISGGDSEE